MSNLQRVEKTKALIGSFGMPEAEYHARPELSNSGIGHLLQSPAHYIANRLAPREPTPAMQLGTATHCAILEPTKFYDTYVASPVGIDRRTKAGKDAWESFIATCPGKLPISSEEFERIDGMIMAAHSHPTVSKLLTGGKPEVSLFWVDEKTGVHCRSRADYLRDDGLIVDLKTTRSASSSNFVKSIGQYAYHRQGAMYLEGGRCALKKPQTAFIFVAIETEPPFGIGVFALDEIAVDIGKREFEKGCEIYAECMASDHWPGYPDGVQSVSLPNWMVRDFDGFQ